MTWEVAVAGTFHNDDLTTPEGRRDALGGSAVYFPLAASRYAPVHVNGIVGSDTAAEFRRILAHPGIDLDGMVVSNSPTFRWHAVHDFERWVTSDESSEPGCDPEWVPVLDRALPPIRGVLCREHGSDTAASRARAVRSLADRRRFDDRVHRDPP